jgi:hypothetical protein
MLIPKRLFVDVELVRSAAINCGGGSNHGAVQITSAYEIAVARYNHKNTKSAAKWLLLGEIENLVGQLHEIGARRTTK